MTVEEIRQGADKKLSADDYKQMSVSDIAQIRMDVKRLLKMVDALRAQQEQPNEPLTPDELREMDGEPVWLHTFSTAQKKTNIAQWAILEAADSAYAVFVRAGCNNRLIKRFTNYSKTWLAYGRKPKQEGQNVNREILFRGKRIDNGEWAESHSILCFSDSIYKLDTIDGWITVDPSTVGQYTGLTDKNGVKIFEGDVLNCSWQGKTAAPVTFSNGMFKVISLITWMPPDYEPEIIGNIHGGKDEHHDKL